MKTLDSIPNRTYKATIFAMLFEDKEHLLELYNAISVNITPVSYTHLDVYKRQVWHWF